MPFPTEAPYLYCERIPSSFFFSQQEPNYRWGIEKSGAARELSYYFLDQVNNNWKYGNPYRQTIVQILSHYENLAKAQQSELFWRKKKFKISLEILEALDELGNWQDRTHAISLMLRTIYYFIHQGYNIGINFREVFLVPDGEAPPPHFRPGIDICVTNVIEYKKITEKFSYQLGKFFLNEFKPIITSQHKNQDSLNQTIIGHYSYIGNLKKADYTTALKDFSYSNCALSAYINSFKQISYKPSRSIPRIFSFTSPVTIAELFPFFQNYSHHEMTLIFKGNQYENEHERQKVYEEILKLIEDSKCTFMVHVVLITRDNLEGNLLDLKPHTERKEELFTPLLQDAGYYLSSPKILSTIYRNIQAPNRTTDHWFEKLEALNKKYQKKPEAQPGAYIRAQEPSENTRKSKMLTRGQLKSKVRLAVTHQETVAQTQTVNEQVQEEHAQNLNLDLGHFVNFSTGNSFSWEFKTNLDGFCKKLEFFAKKHLPKITEKENLLEQAGYLTQFYLKNHSRRHFYEQLANDKNFRLQHAAKLFGNALIADENESDSVIKVKLPHYYIDNIEEYIADKLLRNIENIKDGLPANNRSIKESYIFGRTLYGIQYLYRPTPSIYPPRIYSKLSYLSQLQLEKTEPEKVTSPLYII